MAAAATVESAKPSTPPSTAAAAAFPRSTWRKKPSQKGKYRFRILTPWKTRRKPKTPPLSATKSSIRKARKKKKKAAAGDGVVGVGKNPVRRRLDLEKEEKAGDGVGVGGNSNPLLVRRRLDMDAAAVAAAAEISGGGTPLGFSRATLMANLRSLAKLALGDDIGKPSPRRTLASPPAKKKKIDLRSYSRAQLMDNLTSLAKQNTHLLPLAAVDATSTAAAHEQGGAAATKGKNKKSTPTRRVNKLELRPFKSKDRAANADGGVVPDDDPIAMALVVRNPNDSAGTEVMYVPEWASETVAVPDFKTLRQLVLITPAIEAAYHELVRSDETCLGDDLDSAPEGPELEEERRRLQVLVDKFMGPVRAIIGRREFANWKGSVLTSVVGTFLTQNVNDVHSSNAFTKIAAKFSSANNESNVAQNTDVALITDGCDLGVSYKQRDKGINELITSLRTGEISNWARDEEHINNVLKERFPPTTDAKTPLSPTATKISQDTRSFLEADTSRWKYLLEEAYKNGYRKEETSDSIDWEALLHAPFDEIEECIKDRGTQSQMTFRLKFLLIRIQRDHRRIDLEWLRYIPRAKAKEYLHSIIGIGSKSLDCIRLLSLRHRGFPVDVNIARLSTRLGWVPLQPLGDSIEFHMVDKEPVMDKIQKFLEPLLCKIPSHKLYELHCQMITFGKLICTKQRPNCGACPFTEDCKYYKSLFERGAKNACLDYSQQDKRGQTNMDGRIHDVVMVKANRDHTYQCQIEMGKSIERHSTEPIIEMPPTPPHECPESSTEEDYEQEYHNILDIEDIVPHLDQRSIKPTENATTENATTGLSHGKDMVSIHRHDNSQTPIQRKYHLRTEYLAYIIPDGHEILDKFEPRVHGDCNPYLFIIRGYDDHNVNATILIPCRTASRETFPLDGTYFQINEVFADHSSTHSPIQIKRDILWDFGVSIVYFGTSITNIAKGQTQEGIQYLYHSGFICCREFDRGTRCATTLSPALHTTNTTNVGQKRTTCKKRLILDSSPNPVEG